MYKVCILLATYNGKNYIINQINSILSQKSVLVDLFISDDFSDDGTFELISDHYGFQNNIFILSRVLRYGSAGKNFFSLIRRVDFSKYDYIAFADQDDVWYPDKLISSIDHLNSSNASGLSSCVTAFWADGKRKFVNKSYPQCNFDYMFESPGPGCTFLLSIRLAEAFKERLLKNISLFDKVFYHDWAIYAFSRNYGFKWIILPISTLDYRQHDDNETGVNFGIYAKISRLKKLIKGWYLIEVISISSAIGYTENLRSIVNRKHPFFLVNLLNILQFRRRFHHSIFIFILLSICKLRI